ncbi:hypothetical protein COO60DRAFT_1488043 [Scenedesmus sp. NREL 46B-D3]|nr:hypothetical protein COO60DRAFT_1488043 [Scenedesmus sp. NREL 46B-D3]
MYGITCPKGMQLYYLVSLAITAALLLPMHPSASGNLEAAHTSAPPQLTSLGMPIRWCCWWWSQHVALHPQHRTAHQARCNTHQSHSITAQPSQSAAKEAQAMVVKLLAPHIMHVCCWSMHTERSCR